MDFGIQIKELTNHNIALQQKVTEMQAENENLKALLGDSTKLALELSDFWEQQRWQFF